MTDLESSPETAKRRPCLPEWSWFEGLNPGFHRPGAQPELRARSGTGLTIPAARAGTRQRFPGPETDGTKSSRDVSGQSHSGFPMRRDGQAGVGRGRFPGAERRNRPDESARRSLSASGGRFRAVRTTRSVKMRLPSGAPRGRRRRLLSRVRMDRFNPLTGADHPHGLVFAPPGCGTGCGIGVTPAWP